ncbi:MAG: Response regulator MprA [bacterium]|nr:Response regulator MprA [bacterium]
MSAGRITLVEDEFLIGQLINANLTGEGYRLEWLRSGEGAVEQIAVAAPDLVILDVMLPGEDGFSIARSLRAVGNRVPILMLTAKDDLSSKEAGFSAGVDDYLTKPFALQELKLRVARLIERSRQPAYAPHGGVYQFGPYSVDLRSQEAIGNSGRQTLGRKEFEIMRLFIERRGEVIDRAELIERVWGPEAMPTERTVDNFIVKLRKEFEPDRSQPQYIISVYGRGYRFEG